MKKQTLAFAAFFFIGAAAFSQISEANMHEISKAGAREAASLLESGQFAEAARAASPTEWRKQAQEREREERLSCIGTLIQQMGYNTLKAPAFAPLSSFSCARELTGKEVGSLALLAAIQGNWDAVNQLLDLNPQDGIDFNIKDEHGQSALFYATKAEEDELAGKLIEKGAEPLSAEERALVDSCRSSFKG